MVETSKGTTTRKEEDYMNGFMTQLNIGGTGMLKTIPMHILRDLREHSGLAGDDDSQDPILQALSKEEVLSRWLEWNGIIGYTETILEIVSLT